MKSTSLAIAIGLLGLPSQTAGHGHMLTPRSRNWYAYEVGRDDTTNSPGGIPPREYCSHCLNTKLATETCGRGSAQPYDAVTGWKDSHGDAMPWIAQESYVEGQEILVTSELTTNHAGHMELRACPLDAAAPDDTQVTQECLDAHPLTFVRDVCYGGPVDDFYPVRGYYSTNAFHHFVYKLPAGLTGSRVLLQWRYIAANSCLPPGYVDEERIGLDERGWLRGFSLAECNVDDSNPPQLVLDPTGGRGPGDPEQFWNCAEVSIAASDGTNDPGPHPASTDICTGTVPPPSPTPPTMDPPPPSPTPPSPTPPSPTPPSDLEGYCNWGPLGTALSSTCDGCVQGGDVCNAGAHACESDCGGRWCTNLDAIPNCDGSSNPPPSPSPPPPPPANTNFCGSSWMDAYNATCVASGSTACVDGNSTVCGYGKHCYGGISCPGLEPPPSLTPPTPTPPSPTPPTGGDLMATTTRYWDCSGGACGCAYLPLGPGTDSTPAHCHSNAMFAAPAGNEHGAAFYGAAAVSRFLWDGNANLGDWLGGGCGKCWKVTGASNIGPNVGQRTTLVIKGTNICPTGICNENGKAHFDIAAPGFDVLEYSWSNTCETVEPDELEGFQSCGRWLIDSQDPLVGCDCSKFTSPVLKAGCENFYSLMWDNAPVEYEEVSCPPEMEQLPCWEDNGNGYPQTGVPELCMDPNGDPNVILPFPGASPTDPPPPPSPSPPTPTPPSPTSPSPPTDGYPPITCPEGYKNARWTWYISYPKCCEDQPHYDPNASREECDVYNGCAWDGDFAYVGNRPYSYVKDTNIVAFFASNGETYGKKIISVYSPVHDKTVEAIVLDTCGDSDCNGCCTTNANAGGGYLVDMEEETVLKHFGSLDEVDGRVCWKILPDAEYDAGGYCNWSGCNGEAQGGWDCNLNAYECNTACGGTWCTTSTQATTTPTQAVTTTTQASTTSTTEGSTLDPCCTWDWKTCSDSSWCNESETNCNSCGGPFWQDVDCAADGIAKGGSCTYNQDKCCSGLICYEHSQWYMSCEVPSDSMI